MLGDLSPTRSNADNLEQATGTEPALFNLGYPIVANKRLAHL